MRAFLLASATAATFGIYRVRSHFAKTQPRFTRPGQCLHRNQESLIAFEPVTRMPTEEGRAHSSATYLIASCARGYWASGLFVLKFGDYSGRFAGPCLCFPDGHPNSPTLGHLKFPHPERGVTAG